ncbi:MAG: CPBP family intramembrane glutamic endopeptidase [Janthinobacterium lividum]
MTDVSPLFDANAQDPQIISPWRRLKQHPVTQILVFVGVSTVIFLVIALPLLALFNLTHIKFDLYSERGGLTGWFGLAVAAVIGFILVTRRVHQGTVSEAGLALQGIFSETGIGLMIGGGVFSAVIGMMGAFGLYHTGNINPHFRSLLPLALFLCIAVFQEVAMRGCIFQTLERRWGSGIALIASSLFFGLLHLGSPVEGLTTVQWLTGPLFLSFETSLLFTAAYLLTRRLWLPIGLHWGWNFFETSIYGTANSGAGENNPNTLFAGHVHGPFLVTGGSFGPEASLICLGIGSYAGIVLLRLAIRKGQWRTANYASHQVE